MLPCALQNSFSCASSGNVCQHAQNQGVLCSVVRSSGANEECYISDRITARTYLMVP